MTRLRSQPALPRDYAPGAASLSMITASVRRELQGRWLQRSGSSAPSRELDLDQARNTSEEPGSRNFVGRASSGRIRPRRPSFLFELEVEVLIDCSQVAAQQRAVAEENPGEPLTFDAMPSSQGLGRGDYAKKGHFG